MIAELILTAKCVPPHEPALKEGSREYVGEGKNHGVPGFYFRS
jgi:hypothetical protein